MPRRLSGSADIYEVRRIKTLIRGRTIGGTGMPSMPQPVAQNDMLIANALPAWSLLTGPTAAEQVLISGASPFVPAWTALFDATAPNVIQPDDPAAAGSAATAARRDHEHGVVCAAPAVNLSVSTTNTEGGATSFARSNHSHAITSSSNPGAAARLLATGASGYLRLVGLGIGAAPGSADLHFATGRGITHTDGVAAGQFLRANGTRYLPDTLDVADLTDLAYATPALSFGTVNAAGAANSVIRSNATLALFDATVPDVIQCDDSAAAGAAGVAARRDHTHGIVCAAPAANSVSLAASAEGTATSFARSDHTHNLDEGITPTWTGAHTFNANIVMADGTTIGQAAGPLLTFDDINNYLEIMGCKVGLGTAAPSKPVEIATPVSDNTETLLKLSHRSATLRVGSVIELGAVWTTGMHTKLIGYAQPNATWNTQFEIQTSNAENVWNTGFYQDEAGNIGIKTTGPDHPLEVMGTGDPPMVAGTPAGQFAITPANLMLAFGARESGENYTWIQAAHRTTGAAYYPLGINPNGGNVIVGATTASTKMGRGLTINQVTSDDEILCFKSTDVGHPITDWADANTFGCITKAETTSGGIAVIGYKDADGLAGFAVTVAGRLGENADTTKATNGYGVISLDAAVSDGAASHQVVNADGNLVAIRSSSQTRFIFDAEGEMHSDAIIGVGNDWDEWDDLALAADLSRLPRAKFDEMLRYHAGDFERAGLVTLSTDEDGTRHAFIRHKAMLMFAMCCFGEIHKRFEQLNIKVDNLAISQGVT